MLRNIFKFFLILFAFKSICSNAATTSSPQTTKFQKAPAPLVNMLEEAMNYTYILPDNMYEWNFTLIEIEISKHDPGFWDRLDPCLLVKLVPPDIISTFPVYLLYKYHLCDYIPINATLTENGTLPACEPEDPCGSESSGIDFCVTPLQKSSYQPNLISKYGQQDVSKQNTVVIAGAEVQIDLSECGLQCNQGWQLLGITEKKQMGIDVSKIVSLVLSVCGLLFLFYNQYHDQINSNETFGKKSLLYQLPYFITLAVFVLIVCMAAGVIAGQKKILCNSDGSFSFMNPTYGKNPSCTIFGMIFYGSVAAYLTYTSLLSFVIWRQFYNPMRPLWNIEKRYWHLGVNLIVLIAVSIAAGTNTISGVHPMSVCLPGTVTRVSVLGFMLIPFAVGTTVVIIFLISSMYLIRKRLSLQRDTVNLEHQTKMEDLALRLLWYTLGVLITMLILLFIAARVYKDFDIVREAFSISVQCQARNYYAKKLGLPLETCIRTTTSPPALYILWPIACVSAVFAQVILTCNSERRTRLKRSMTRTGSKVKEMEQSMVNQLKRVRSKPMDGDEKSPEPKSPVDNNKIVSSSDDGELPHTRNTQVDVDILPPTYQASTMPRDSTVAQDVEFTQFPATSELKMKSGVSSFDGNDE